jgi:hypothetical protein
MSVYSRSSSEEEAASPELRAGGATQPVSPMPEHDSQSGDDNEDVGKKIRTLNKDKREWESFATIKKGEDAVHDPEDIKNLICEAAKKVMEDSGSIKLATHRPKPTDLHLWKHRTSWDADGNTTRTTIYYCPLRSKFGCMCQLKVTDMSRADYVEKRSVHDKDSHSSDKDKSKFLNLHQIEAIRSGVIITPNQTAKHLRGNLMHASPEKRIAPTLARSVQRQVRKFRVKLTEAKLDGNSVDDSYGSHVALADAKWFTTLLANHNDPDCDFHFEHVRTVHHWQRSESGRGGKFPLIPENFGFFEIFSYFLKKPIQKLSEIRNLNFVTSELDSESLSTLRKNKIKRDSCKVDDKAGSVIISCAKKV